MSCILNMTNPYKDELALETVLRYCAGYTSLKTKCEFAGGYGADFSSVQNALRDMIAVKHHFGKEGGKQLYHLIYSVQRQTDSTNKKYLEKKLKEEGKECYRIAPLVSQYFYSQGFQNMYFKHKDTAVHHIHFVLNSVSWIDGKKLDGIKSLVEGSKAYLAKNYIYHRWGNLIHKKGFEIEDYFE